MSTPLITNIIPQQGFEIVRNAIGAVLKCELDSQKLLSQGTPREITQDINIYVGRSTPFAQSEVLMINVSLDSTSSQNFNEKDQQVDTNFHIDIHAKAKETATKKGGEEATILRDRFVGMVRYILSDHHYKTLSLPVGTIMGTYFTGFEVYEPENNQDTSYVKMARMNFMVRINESASQWAGVISDEIFTTLTLDNTDRGTKIINEFN